MQTSEKYDIKPLKWDTKFFRSKLCESNIKKRNKYK